MCGEGDGLKVNDLFPAIPKQDFVPADFPFTRRTKLFRKKDGTSGQKNSIKHGYTKFTHGKGLFGALIRAHFSGETEKVPYEEVLEHAFWVEELKIERVTPKSAAKHSATKTSTKTVKASAPKASAKKKVAQAVTKTITKAAAKSAKKKNRPSPSESATSVKEGTKKRGNDGNMWITKKNSAGVPRWVKL